MEIRQILVDIDRKLRVDKIAVMAGGEAMMAGTVLTVYPAQVCHFDIF